MLTAAVVCAAAILVYFVALRVFRDRMTNLQFAEQDLARLPLRVPNRFLWGSATSAYQVEGCCTNANWHRFESSVSAEGAPRISGGQRAGTATDHWNRYRQDIALMKDLSLNAYRFSLEWSKIEPLEGTFDEDAIDHYASVIADLRAEGIVPMVTLHHFTNPNWFEDRGAFLSDDAPRIFGRFVRKVVTCLGRGVDLWMTVNEPTVYALNGYLFGEFPPGERNPKKAVRVLWNVLQAHTEAYRIIKDMRPSAQVGLGINFFVFDPRSSLSLPDVLAARFMTRTANESLLHYLNTGEFTFGIPGIGYVSSRTGIRDSYDFVGLNYYTRFHPHVHPLSWRIAVDRTAPGSGQRTDMGWEIYPEGLYRALSVIRSHTARPIYITENGLADDSDTKRGSFIRDHLLVMNRAISEGIDIRGYFYWSLLDNFEWAFGYSKRFGLYHVDFSTQQRTLRPGSRSYTDMIRQFQSS